MIKHRTLNIVQPITSCFDWWRNIWWKSRLAYSQLLDLISYSFWFLLCFWQVWRGTSPLFFFSQSNKLPWKDSYFFPVPCQCYYLHRFKAPSCRWWRSSTRSFQSQLTRVKLFLCCCFSRVQVCIIHRTAVIQNSSRSKIQVTH